MVNRKKCEQALANRKRLKDVDMTDLKFEVDTRIFLNDSLCPYYRGIYGKCKSLYREKLIHGFWTYNGIVRIKVTEKGAPKTITHDDDLYKIFPNFKF